MISMYTIKKWWYDKKQIWVDAKKIRQENGLKGVSKSTLTYLISLIYKNQLWLLYEYEIKIEKDQVISFKAHQNLKMDDINFVVVSGNEEADKLEMQGFVFRSYPTSWNVPPGLYKRQLDMGAIAFCTFVGKDLGAINWAILSQQTQKRWGAPPLKVNYNLEVFGRGAWVNPKYRRLGLYRYTVRNRDRFLSERGITSVRTVVGLRNKVGQGIGKGVGAKKYGTARLVTILGWRKSWRETHEPNRTQT